METQESKTESKGKVIVFNFKDGVLKLQLDEDGNFVDAMKLTAKDDNGIIKIEGHIEDIYGRAHDIITVTRTWYGISISNVKFIYDDEVPPNSEDIWVLGDTIYYSQIFEHDYKCSVSCDDCLEYYKECLKDKSIFILIEQILDTISPKNIVGE